MKDDVLSMITLESANPIARTLEEAIEAWKFLPQTEMPVTNRFLPGVYLRELFIPAGTFAIGHVHRTQHVNIVLSGRVLANVRGEVKELKAGEVIESTPGVQKAVLALEDTRWLTVHPNPSDERDVVKVEEQIFEFTAAFLAEKGDRTLDETRMSRSTTPQILCPEQHLE